MTILIIKDTKGKIWNFNIIQGLKSSKIATAWLSFLASPSLWSGILEKVIWTIYFLFFLSNDRTMILVREKNSWSKFVKICIVQYLISLMTCFVLMEKGKWGNIHFQIEVLNFTKSTCVFLQMTPWFGAFSCSNGSHVSGSAWLRAYPASSSIAFASLALMLNYCPNLKIFKRG